MSSPENDVRKYLNLVIRHKGLFALAALSIMTMGVIYSYVAPKKYESQSTVFIEKNVIAELVKGIVATPSMDDTVRVLTYAINSRTLVMKVINALDLNLHAKSAADLEALVSKFQNSTQIKVRDKDLFIISFRHENPKIARDYVNTLVRSYIEENVSAKREESYDATKFLSGQIATYREKLEKAEEAVVNYKREKGGIINLDESRLLQEISTAQQKLYDLQLRRRLLEGQQHVTRKTPDPLLTNLAALKKRLDELRVEYTDNYPEVIKVKGDIETLKAQITSRKGTDFSSTDPNESIKIEEELNAIKASESSLQRYIAQNQSMLTGIPSAKATLEQLEAEKRNQKTMYDQLFTRHDQSEVSKQMELQDKSSTFRVVDPAVTSATPIGPGRVRIILMGIAAGLAGGAGLLLLMDYLDRSIKTVNSLKSLGVPVLAVIPRMKIDSEILMERRKNLRIYLASGLWFSGILGVLVMETLRGG